ncbi:MAG: hypothetical protein IPJ48_04090 [Propionivibrio sp.]|uniref:Uncharacterized protein n=1 Tax=Candidatus Propionivibrio dominans TaxID=2954373 RepID=A0A9D7I6K1_9RHOO|nr:hypothetical protein [Candidatus Propionivibrio dominans]MBL0167433.1 hypothetical protein [Propionivibrio sp.]
MQKRGEEVQYWYQNMSFISNMSQFERSFEQDGSGLSCWMSKSFVNVITWPGLAVVLA